MVHVGTGFAELCRKALCSEV